MDKYEDLIEQYVEKFDEGFPTFMAPGGEEEHMEIIKNCLKTGKSYDPYTDPILILMLTINKNYRKESETL